MSPIPFITKCTLSSALAFFSSLFIVIVNDGSDGAYFFTKEDYSRYLAEFSVRVLEDLGHAEKEEEDEEEEEEDITCITRFGVSGIRININPKILA